MLVVGLSLLILTGEGLVHTGSWGEFRISRQHDNERYASFMQLQKSHHRLPWDSFCTRCFLSRWYYSHSWKLWVRYNRQITGARSEGYQRQRCKHKTLSPHFQVHTKEVSGVCMLWLIHQVVKTKRFISPFWLLADHLCPPKAGVGLQTAFLWDSAVKWDLQYFCVSECWVGILKKKKTIRIILHLIKEKQF